MALIINDFENLSTVYFKNITQFDTGIGHLIKNGGVLLA